MITKIEHRYVIAVGTDFGTMYIGKNGKNLIQPSNSYGQLYSRRDEAMRYAKHHIFDGDVTITEVQKPLEKSRRIIPHRVIPTKMLLDTNHPERRKSPNDGRIKKLR